MDELELTSLQLLVHKLLNVPPCHRRIWLSDDEEGYNISKHLQDNQITSIYNKIIEMLIYKASIIEQEQIKLKHRKGESMNDRK